MIHAVASYILAGGKSSRFGGQDKARAVVHGRAMILHVAACLPPFARPVTAIAANADAFADLGLRTISDRIPGKGPLSGLHAALLDAPGEWVLLVSCDLVGLRPAWIEQIAAAVDPQADAAAFRDEFWHPMPGLYRKTLLSDVERRLGRDELAMQSLLNAARTRLVPRPPDWGDLVQANTPQDLNEYLARDPSSG